MPQPTITAVRHSVASFLARCGLKVLLQPYLMYTLPGIWLSSVFREKFGFSASQKLYFKATCIWRIVLALVITPKVDGVCALADGVFQFG